MSLAALADDAAPEAAAPLLEREAKRARRGGDELHDRVSDRDSMHQDYGVGCEVKRMSRILESLRLDGNTMRVVFVRYNPHDFTVDGAAPRGRSARYRHRQLTALLLELQTEAEAELNAPSSRVADVRVFYMFYDAVSDATGRATPVVFDEVNPDDGSPEYAAAAKEWFARCVV